MMATTRESVHLLCKSIITRLENQKAISFAARLRGVIQDEVTHLIGPFIMTDEDLRTRALEKMGARVEMLEDSAFTESEQFKVARSIVRATFGDDVLNGFYFQKSLKVVSDTIIEYLMRSSHIDDVYETDETLRKEIIEIAQRFNPTALR